MDRVDPFEHLWTRPATDAFGQQLAVYLDGCDRQAKVMHGQSEQFGFLPYDLVEFRAFLLPPLTEAKPELGTMLTGRRNPVAPKGYFRLQMRHRLRDLKCGQRCAVMRLMRNGGSDSQGHGLSSVYSEQLREVSSVGHLFGQLYLLDTY